MTATVHHLASPGQKPPRYPDHIDLRSIIRQGQSMTRRITYAQDSWNLDGAPAVSGRASPRSSRSESWTEISSRPSRAELRSSDSPSPSPRLRRRPTLG